MIYSVNDSDLHIVLQIQEVLLLFSLTFFYIKVKAPHRSIANSIIAMEYQMMVWDLLPDDHFNSIQFGRWSKNCTMPPQIKIILPPI